MKRVFIIILIFFHVNCYASQKAITDTGDEVILFNDGTWKYSDNVKTDDQKIKTNETKFKKPESATFKLKSKRNKSAFWLNTKKWIFQKATSNAEAEYEFQLKGQDLYGMSISEGVHIPLESLVEIALARPGTKNASIRAPNCKRGRCRNFIIEKRRKVPGEVERFGPRYCKSDWHRDGFIDGGRKSRKMGADDYFCRPHVIYSQQTGRPLLLR